MKIYQAINTLVKNNQVNQIFLILDSEKRFTKTNKPYAIFTAKDVTGTIKIKVWDWDIDKKPPGQWIKVDGTVSDYNKQLHIAAKEQNVHVCPNAPENIDDYIRGIPNQVVDQWYQEILGSIDGVENRFMRAMLDFEFRQNEKHIVLYKTICSSHNVRQSYKGGFLQHLNYGLKVVQILQHTYADRGVSISRDLIITGWLLHDIGKLYAFQQDGNVWTQTDEQRLLNHLPMSLYIVQQLFIFVESALQEEIPQDIKNAISHIIISHHGEYGPMTPRTVEAEIVHQADMIDSRLTLFIEAKETKKPNQDWIDYHRLIGSPVWTKDIE